MRRFVGALVLWFAGALGLAQGTSALILGAANAGGLEPIARWSNGAWVNTWPPTADYDRMKDVVMPRFDDIPREWLGGPVPVRWTLWSLAGDSRDVSVAGAPGRERGCEVPLELGWGPGTVIPKTDFGPAGLAIAGGEAGAFESPDDIDAATADGRAIDRVARRLLADGEQAAADTYVNANRLSPYDADLLSARARAGAPITMDRLFRARDSAGRPMVFFRIAKRIATGRTHGVAAEGWLRRDDTGAWTPDSVTVRAFDETTDFHRRPMGVIRVEGRAFWVLIGYAYEGRWYEIVEAAERMTPRLRVSGGGC